MSEISVKEIDQILPQTQCTQCGYEDCFAYAKAIKQGVAHNQCPPGGQKGIDQLSQLLNRQPLPLNPENGQYEPKKLAVIDESMCIGCTKCILACPTDAIVGANKKMHTVIKEDCTGCGLCVEPCPMDCISMEVLPTSEQPEMMASTAFKQLQSHYRTKHYKKQARQAKQERLNRQKHQKNKNLPEMNAQSKQAYIQNALKQFRQKKQSLTSSDE